MRTTIMTIWITVSFIFTNGCIKKDETVIPIGENLVIEDISWSRLFSIYGDDEGVPDNVIYHCYRDIHEEGKTIRQKYKIIVGNMNEAKLDKVITTLRKSEKEYLRIRHEPIKESVGRRASGGYPVIGPWEGDERVIYVDQAYVELVVEVGVEVGKNRKEQE
jgi:hypothetical protein